jgi:hypothetical protein
MTQQPEGADSLTSADSVTSADGAPNPDSLDSEVTPAEADSPYASAADGAVDTTQADADASVEPAPDVAEEYAESIPIDPTPEQVEHYLELAGDPDALTESGSADRSAGA